ncbi:VacJ family lipoprotein [Sphingobium sufflavum]|uniref:MlaA family lipoprotein n=1 Tax=Sphingobium sufflavum TaxID=1129547 RepID=UPI001F2B6A63|nr:VacJ family lipoprotein [Sphingobium sufflavum]MCE7796043.1 VacJ family lipoprotein [Sphingobium sufflavum]
MTVSAWIAALLLTGALADEAAPTSPLPAPAPTPSSAPPVPAASAATPDAIAPGVGSVQAETPEGARSEATGDQAPVQATAPAPAPTPVPPSTATPTPTSTSAATGAAADETDIVVKARHHAPPGDPLEAVNMKTFAVVQGLDKILVRPASKAYQRILPDPLRSGIRNVINNLREPVVFLNFLLQLKPGKAFETVGRFAINSTIGGAGLFDIARRKPFHLPRRPNGLGNTLGYYGVGPGPFFYLPIFGPTTLRDLIGDNLDRGVLPAAVGTPFDKPAYVLGIGSASSLDQRAEFDEKLEELHRGSDPYAQTRADYLRSRQAAIDALRGRRAAPPPVPVSPAANVPAPVTVAPVTGAADPVAPAGGAPSPAP